LARAMMPDFNVPERVKAIFVVKVVRENWLR
jgi:hypothetical protein